MLIEEGCIRSEAGLRTMRYTAPLHDILSMSASGDQVETTGTCFPASSNGSSENGWQLTEKVPCEVVGLDCAYFVEELAGVVQESEVSTV